MQHEERQLSQHAGFGTYSNVWHFPPWSMTLEAICCHAHMLHVRTRLLFWQRSLHHPQHTYAIPVGITK